MWRAYGGMQGVAIVFKVLPTTGQKQVNNLIMSPVAYLEDVKDDLRAILANISANKSLLKGLSQVEYENNIMGVLTLAAVCIKHAGFAEEEEWRILFLSNVFQPHPLAIETETVNGVPQLVCKLRMDTLQAEGYGNAHFDRLIDKVIIGPTNNPLPVFDALNFEMRRAGIIDPAKRIYTSNIPLRTS